MVPQISLLFVCLFVCGWIKQTDTRLFLIRTPLERRITKKRTNTQTHLLVYVLRRIDTQTNGMSHKQTKNQTVACLFVSFTECQESFPPNTENVEKYDGVSLGETEPTNGLNDFDLVAAV